MILSSSSYYSTSGVICFLSMEVMFRFELPSSSYPLPLITLARSALSLSLFSALINLFFVVGKRSVSLLPPASSTGIRTARTRRCDLRRRHQVADVLL